MVGEEERERVTAIRQAFQADKDKLTKIKTLLVSTSHYHLCPVVRVCVLWCVI